MPDIDVSHVLTNPRYAMEIQALRRFEDITDQGRVDPPAQEINPRPVGVIQPISEGGMVRGPDQQHIPRRIAVYSQFRFRAASDDYQPDQILWKGATYVVVSVDDWTDYGAGYVRVEASSDQATEPPPGKERWRP